MNESKLYSSFVFPAAPEIFYHPPKSASFGHSSVPRDPRAGWQRTLDFLDAATIPSLRKKPTLRIHCYPKWSDVKLIEQCIDEATEQFGEPSNSDVPLSKQWEISMPLLSQAVAFALRDVIRAPQEIGPTRLYFCYDLLWKDHPSLPSIDRPGDGSYLGVFHGGRRLFLQPFLRFPFESTSPEFSRFVTYLQRHLPFKFREANFKVMLPSANGKLPRIRKLPQGWMTTPPPLSREP